jgi:hypothetical protein
VENFARSLVAERGGPRNKANMTRKLSTTEVESFAPIARVEKPALSLNNFDSSKLIRRQMVDDRAQPRLGTWGGKRARGEQPDNVSLKYGNSRAYLLARLERDRPDLAAQVEAGEVSAFSVAVELGWARRPIYQPGKPAPWRAFDPAAMIG